MGGGGIISKEFHFRVVGPFPLQGSANTSASALVTDLGWTEVRAKSILVSRIM